MSVEGSFTSMLIASLFVAACAGQDPYDLHFADGRGVENLPGIRSCMEAFGKNVRLTRDGFDGVCVPRQEGRPVVRLRPIEMTNLWTGKPPATEKDLSGELASEEVGWNILPPWARGSFYSLRHGMSGG